MFDLFLGSLFSVDCFLRLDLAPQYTHRRFFATDPVLDLLLLLDLSSLILSSFLERSVSSYTFMGHQYSSYLYKVLYFLLFSPTTRVFSSLIPFFKTTFQSFSPFPV